MGLVGAELGDVDTEQSQPRLAGPWWFRSGRSLSETQRQEVLQQVFFEGRDLRPFLARFSVMMVMAVLIAGFGLARDSGPVVIGAMLISPLTTPLMGLCAALVLGHPRRQLNATMVLVGASLGGIALAAAMMFVLPESQSTTLQSQELLDRTEPSMVDLAIAIVAGVAGAYVLVRREAIAALPGVAIAVALVPPLTTVGITLELGRGDLADDALLLYLTNLAGIVLAGAGTLLVLGVGADPRAGRLPRRIKLGLSIALGATILIAAPLAEHSRQEIGQSRDRDDARALAEQWAEPSRLDVSTELIDDDEVVINAIGPDPPPPADSLAAAIATELDEEVSVTIRWTERTEERLVGSP